MIGYIPNALSIFRLITGLLFLVFGQIPAPVPQLILLTTALLSDLFDGWLARKFSVSSVKGALLDSSADKLFILVLMVKLVIYDVLPLWILILVLLEYFVIGAVGLNFVVDSHQATKPSFFAKSSSFVAAITVILGVAFSNLHNVILILSAITVILTFLHVASTVQNNLIRHMMNKNRFHG